MKEHTKKRVIVLLLFISCIVSGYFLWEVSKGGTQRLRSFTQADSLIRDELRSYSITPQQIQVHTVNTSSEFKRKIYRVDLPEAFSKTQLHASLNRRLHPLGILTPAKVAFPDRNMDIHLYYNDGVFRTIRLQTDSKLRLSRNRASIMVAFDELPDGELLNTLASLGEPIPIILSITHPMQANELVKLYSGRYSRLLFWLKDEDGNDLLRSSPAAARRRLKQFENVLPNAKLLLVHQSEEQVKTPKQIAAQTDLTFVDASGALRLHRELGKASFMEELEKLTGPRARSLAVVTGNETTLNWLEEKLPELKRAGVELIPPNTITF